MAFTPIKFTAGKALSAQQLSQVAPASNFNDAGDPANQVATKKPGLLASLASPFTKLGASGANVLAQGVGLGAKALGYNNFANKLQGSIDQARTEGIDYGPLGKATPLGQKGSIGANIKEAVGTGLEAGSYAIPVGKTLKGMATAGATMSGLSSAGSTLQEGGTVGEALLAGLEAAPIGALTGGAFYGAGKAVSKIAPAISSTAKYATKQITGLNENTVKMAFKTPEKLSTAQKAGFDRNAVADEVADVIRKGVGEVQNTGKEYGVIRKLDKTVSVPPDTFSAVLNKYGLNIKPVTDKAGNIVDAEIIKTAESVPLKSGDIKALKDYYLQYGKETTLSANGLLNARQGLDALGEVNVLLEKSSVANKIALDARKLYDTIAEKQLPELKAIDKKYAPIRQQYQKLQKEYLNGDGTLKDNAINKIANLTTAGKREVLGRLEKVAPGISEKINIAAALKDVMDSTGAKVGTYARGVVLGGAGLATGNIPVAIMGALVSNPEIAVKIIMQAGKLNNKLTPYASRIVEKMSVGKKLGGAEKKLVYQLIGEWLSKEGENKDTQTGTDEYLKSLGL